MLRLEAVSTAAASQIAERGEAATTGDDAKVSGCGGVVTGADCAGVGAIVPGHVFLDVSRHVVDTEQAAARVSRSCLTDLISAWARARSVMRLALLAAVTVRAGACLTPSAFWWLIASWMVVFSSVEL